MLLARGMARHLGLPSITRDTDVGESASGRYCYSVWLRHIVRAHSAGLRTELGSVAELGPGSSIGVGLAALLSGAHSYYAADVVEYACTQSNIDVLEELVHLFSARAPIPDEEEFPHLFPRLSNYAFPDHVLPNERLQASLKPERVAAIRNAVRGQNADSSDVRIVYAAPWTDPSIIDPDSLDVMVSQAVLEHVDDLEQTYRVMYNWLRPGGFMSHQIDLRCHGTTRDWNGHWTVSDLLWKISRGRRLYHINRLPCSAHLAAISKAGFESVNDSRREESSRIGRRSLAARFRGLPDDDLTTSGLLVQAAKPGRR